MAGQPDPELLARLARLGVQLGTQGLPQPPRPPAEPPAEEQDRPLEPNPPTSPQAPAPSDTYPLPISRPSQPPSSLALPPHLLPSGPPDPAASHLHPVLPTSPTSTTFFPLTTDPHQPAILPLEAALPGRDHLHGPTRCWITDARRPLEDVHAQERLADGLDACPRSLAALAGDPALAGLDLRRTAFLDTETTGLAGGSGTYAFLIGIGRLEGDCFTVRQFFMRHPGEEEAQLAAAAEWLEGCEGLVTFNGRSFDMPLLSTRCVLHRRRPFLAGAPHLDLLPAARRVWRRRLERCNLTALEREVFGDLRQDDVPGWLIPYRYFRYQQDGDARPLVGIFHHNLLDILTMVSLTARLARAWQAPEETLAHGLDWLSLARRYESAGEPARAIAACRGALDRGLAPAEALEARQQMALVARRAGDWEQACAVWESLVREEGGGRLFPYEELAKYWEHRARPSEPARALDLCRAARAELDAGRLQPLRGRRRAAADLDQRIARLERRVARAARGSERSHDSTATADRSAATRTDTPPGTGSPA